MYPEEVQTQSVGYVCKVSAPRDGKGNQKREERESRVAIQRLGTGQRRWAIPVPGGSLQGVRVASFLRVEVFVLEIAEMACLESV